MNFANGRTHVIGNNGNNHDNQYQSVPIVNRGNSRTIGVNNNGFNPRVGGVRNIPQHHVINSHNSQQSQNGGSTHFQQSNGLRSSNIQSQSHPNIVQANVQTIRGSSNRNGQVILIRGNDGQLRILQPQPQRGQSQNQYVIRQTAQVVTPSPIAEPVKQVLMPVQSARITGKSAAAPSLQIAAHHSAQQIVAAGKPVKLAQVQAQTKTQDNAQAQAQSKVQAQVQTQVKVQAQAETQVKTQAPPVAETKVQKPPAQDVVNVLESPITNIVVTAETSKVASGADLKAQEETKALAAKIAKDHLAANHKALGIVVPDHHHHHPAGHGHQDAGHVHQPMTVQQQHPDILDPFHRNSPRSPLSSLSRALLGRMGAMGMGGGLGRASALFGHPMSMRRRFGPFGMMDPFMGGLGPMMDIGDTTDPPDPSEMPRPRPSPTKQSDPATSTRGGRRGQDPSTTRGRSWGQDPSTTRGGRRGPEQSTSRGSRRGQQRGGRRGQERGGRRRSRNRQRRPRPREQEVEEIELEDLPPTTTAMYEETTTTTPKPTTTTTRPTTDSTKLVLSLAEKLISFFAGSMDRRGSRRFPGSALELMSPDSVIDPIPQKEAIVSPTEEVVTTPFTVTSALPLEEVPTQTTPEFIKETTVTVPVTEVISTTEQVPSIPAPTEPSPTEPPAPEVVHEVVHHVEAEPTHHLIETVTEPIPASEVVHDVVHHVEAEPTHHLMETVPEPTPDPEVVQAEADAKAAQMLTDQLSLRIEKVFSEPALLNAPEAEVVHHHVFETVPSAEGSHSENGDPQLAAAILSHQLQIGMDVIGGGDPNMSPVNLEAVHAKHSAIVADTAQVPNLEHVTSASVTFVTVPQAQVVLPEEEPAVVHNEATMAPVEPEPLHEAIAHEAPLQDALPAPHQEPIPQEERVIQRKPLVYVTPKSNLPMVFVTPKRPKVPVPLGSQQMLAQRHISSLQQPSQSGAHLYITGNQASSAMASPVASQPVQSSNSRTSSAVASPVARLPIPYVKRPETRPQFVRLDQPNVGVGRPLVVNVRTHQQTNNRAQQINNRPQFLARRHNGKLTIYVKRKPDIQTQQVEIRRQIVPQNRPQPQVSGPVYVENVQNQQAPAMQSVINTVQALPTSPQEGFVRQQMYVENVQNLHTPSPPQEGFVPQQMFVENVQNIHTPVVQSVETVLQELPSPAQGGFLPEGFMSQQMHVNVPIHQHIETVIESPPPQLLPPPEENTYVDMILHEQVIPSMENIIQELTTVPEDQVLEGPPPETDEMFRKNIKSKVNLRPVLTNTVEISAQTRTISKPKPIVNTPVKAVIKTIIKTKQVGIPISLSKKQMNAVKKTVNKPKPVSKPKPIVNRPVKAITKNVIRPQPVVSKSHIKAASITKPIAKSKTIVKAIVEQPNAMIEQLPRSEMLALAPFESSNDIGGVSIQKIEKTPTQLAVEASGGAVPKTGHVATLLAGLKELLVSHKHPASATAAPCTPTSPTFKCRGKDMFGQMDNMAAWCLGMCIKKACVDTVCTCGCNLKPAPTALSPTGGPFSSTPFGPRGTSNRVGPRGRGGARRRGRFGRRRRPGNGGQMYRVTTMPTTTEATEEPPEEEEEEYEAEDGTTTQAPTSPSPDFYTNDNYYYDYDYGHTHPSTPVSPTKDFELTPLDHHSTQMRKIGPHVEQIKNVAWASDRLPNLGRPSDGMPNLAEAQVSNNSFGGLSNTATEHPPVTAPSVFNDSPSRIRRPDWSGTRWELPPAPTKPPKRSNWSRRRLRSKWSRGSSFNNDNHGHNQVHNQGQNQGWGQPHDTWASEFNSRGGHGGGGGGRDNRLSRLRFTWTNSGGEGGGGGEEEGADR